MGAELKIGLVGCGAHAGSHVRGLLGARDSVAVTAVCDLDPERAALRGAELAAARVYADYEAFLGEADVDGVLLCLPHRTHAPATIAAARAGKHVLVEKPITTSLADANAMIEAADSAGVTLMVAHNQRFFPEHQRVRALLDEGAIGTIYCARADHNQEFLPPGSHWIRRREEAGGGATMGYGVHRIDLLRWLVGEIAQVAHFQHAAPDRRSGFEGETSAVTIFTFANGAIGEMAINWTARRPPWMDMLYLYGDQGSIHNVGGLFVDSRRHSGALDGVVKVDVPDADPFAEQIRHFAACVLNGTEPLTSGADARKTLEVCLAAYESARTGQVIRLPLPTANQAPT